MLRNSFIFLDKYGNRTKRIEQQLWSQGILTWNDFLAAENIPRISNIRKAFYDKKIIQARQAFLEQDTNFFAKLFPRQEHWRLYEDFKEECLFLDIETAYCHGNITIIGLFDGINTKIMVKGKNLDKKLLANELKNHKLIITFNGSSFDLPIIQKQFDMEIEIPHIDLRHLCSKVGLTGGLKSIEQQIGIQRPDVIKYVYGDDAAFLWHKYRNTGNEEYLKLLIEYNEEDVINLKPLAELVVKKLWERTFKTQMKSRCV